MNLIIKKTDSIIFLINDENNQIAKINSPYQSSEIISLKLNCWFNWPITDVMEILKNL